MIRAKRENMEKDTDKDMNETSLIFTGDIGFDKYMDGKWEDENLLSPEILHFLHSADHVIANVEGPLLKAAPSGLSSPARRPAFPHPPEWHRVRHSFCIP